MVRNMGYPVRVNRKETVAGVLPLQEHWLPLSNLDLLLPPVDVGVFFCYNPAINTSFPEMVNTLKSSLVKVLVTYYAFAGELVINSAGEPELLCNNRGVDFIEASAEMELAKVSLHDPDEDVAKLVPKKTNGVLCVQATELKCGGLVLGCTFDHRIADAYSANMFLVSWAETARLKPISMIPSFRRSLLSPRRPGYYDEYLDSLYVPVSSLPAPAKDPIPAPEAEQAINRIYYIKAEEVNRIQAAAKKRSKLEAFTGFLWGVIAKGAKQMGARACSMGVVVDGRSRVGKGGSMSNYFGNVLSIPYGTMEVAEVEEMAVGAVADAVHELLREAMTEEHFRGIVDWVEAHRPVPGVARIYCGGCGGDELVGEVAVVVSSGRGFPVAEVEFGWGRPAFGSYHFPWGGTAGYVMPMPSATGNGDWVVYAHLSPGLVAAVEAEAGDVLLPLTADYVMLNNTAGD